MVSRKKKFTNLMKTFHATSETGWRNLCYFYFQRNFLKHRWHTVKHFVCVTDKHLSVRIRFFKHLWDDDSNHVCISEGTRSLYSPALSDHRAGCWWPPVLLRGWRTWQRHSLLTGRDIEKEGHYLKYEEGRQVGGVSRDYFFFIFFLLFGL